MSSSLTPCLRALAAITRFTPTTTSYLAVGDLSSLPQPTQSTGPEGERWSARAAATLPLMTASLTAGPVALPAGTTVGQRQLPRVGDHDLLAADTSGPVGRAPAPLGALRSVQPWPPAYSRAIGFLAGAANQPRRTCGRSIRWRGSSVHWVCCEGLPGSCHETVTCVKPPHRGSHRSPRSPVGSRTTARSRRPVSPRVRLRECRRCRAASRGRDSR